MAHSYVGGEDVRRIIELLEEQGLRARPSKPNDGLAPTVNFDCTGVGGSVQTYTFPPGFWSLLSTANFNFTGALRIPDPIQPSLFWSVGGFSKVWSQARSLVLTVTIPSSGLARFQWQTNPAGVSSVPLLGYQVAAGDSAYTPWPGPYQMWRVDTTPPTLLDTGDSQAVTRVVPVGQTWQATQIAAL